ncbi:MAG: hypothetical protein OHK0015_01600 [Chloroflexi bacterium OHK40]
MTIRYFIPDWDDRVDPGYNFLTDEHSHGRNPYRDDRYAHELYPEPPYDGVLLSRAVIDDSPAKGDAILDAGSVHRYLRLPADHPVIGDCGAFSYWQAEEPPYRTDEILEYYQRLGFDIGVSIDHLIFAELEDERQRRWDITLQNAEDFLVQHRAGGYTFTPMGVAQGWNPASYARAARALIQMGYTHIAAGGLVRSQTADVVAVLAAIQAELRPGTQLHLFGVNRPEQIGTFAQLGVTSFDSASRLRRAWMDGRRNYFLGNSAYTAIRVPEARALAKKKGVDEATALRLERAALGALRAYDAEEIGLDETLGAVLAYAALFGEISKSIRRDYYRTLAQRPWTYCPCEICIRIGVEVVIFRGNNRNRRRGFHNTWQLYRQLRGEAQELPPPLPDDGQGAAQFTLSL